jgi:energy-coupling factor transporter ATP-binding protein EcfA2
VFLKTLQIKGFKSFADSATLNLEPGVTVVVGPNGSGKSNVVDAIGWVLGAQAPSAVRSQKMDDVIFAGLRSDRRSGVPRCRSPSTTALGVTADRVLRGHDHPDPVPQRRQRVLHQRRALPTARHPGAPERLGRGPSAARDHQPGPDRRRAERPAEDRRLIIEEAAGVLKYRRRKEKSERRLASTEANLLRIQDLLREVRRQLRPLERRPTRLVATAPSCRADGARLHLAGRETRPAPHPARSRPRRRTSWQRRSRAAHAAGGARRRASSPPRRAVGDRRRRPRRRADALRVAPRTRGRSVSLCSPNAVAASTATASSRPTPPSQRRSMPSSPGSMQISPRSTARTSPPTRPS